VALAVLIPVLVVTTGMFPYYHLINYRSRCLAQAALVAQAETERLRSVARTDLANSQRPVRGDRVDFTVTSRVARAGSNRLHRAEVTVSWSDQAYRVVTLLETGP
jgi:hypothetical protein